MKRIRNFLITLVIAILISCSTPRIQEIPVETVKIEYVTNNTIDSVYVKDSVDRWVNGDTIFIYKEKIKYKLKYKQDTIIKTDSIPKIISVIKEVEVNHINWYQRVLMFIGGATLLGIVTFVIYKTKSK